MKSLSDDLALLQACGEALYGEDWRPALRRQFHIHPTTTRRWMNGEAIVPRTLWLALIEHMHERAAMLHRLAGEIDRSLDKS